MTVTEAGGQASGTTPPQNSWLLKRDHVDGFERWLRLAVAVVGVGLTGVGVFAILRVPAAEAGGTTLVITGAVLLLLAIVGRFPTKVSAGDWEVEFSKDALEEILEVVSSEAPDIFDTVVAIARGGSRTRATVDSAINASQEFAAREATFDVDTVKELENVMSRASRPNAKSTAQPVSFEREVVVRVPSRGQPPRVDATFTFRGRTVAVEVKSRWARSTADAVARRLSRVLTSDGIKAAVLIVPEESVPLARSQINDDRIVVVDPENLATVPASLEKVMG